MGIEENKKVYKKISKIAVPIAIESFINNFVNFVDVFMVGMENATLGLGKVALAALGISNQIFFVYVISLFGIYSGFGILASQYYGGKDFKILKKLFGFSICVGLIFSIPFVIFGIFKPYFFLSFYTKDTKTLIEGIKYFRIIIFTFPIVSLIFAVTLSLRSIKLPKYSLYSSVIGLVVNVSLNFILIYGKFGFPAMGVRGAAYATLIARIVSLLYLFYIIYKHNLPIVGKLKEMFTIDLQLIVKIFKISIPSFANEVLWTLGIAVKVMIFGRIGVNQFAAIQIAQSINSLFFTLIIGVGSATSIIVGNKIGSGDSEGAFDLSKICIRMMIKVTLIMSTSLIILAPFILKIMQVETSLYELAKTIIFVQSFILLFNSTAYNFNIGIFRSGGDILYPSVISIVALWLVAIPLTYITGIILEWHIAIVIIFASSDELIKLVPFILRYRSKKWIKNLVSSKSE